MINREKITEAITFAREMNLKSIEVDGIKFDVPPNAADTVEALDDQELAKALDIMDDLTDDEILYWATPYFDELQAEKEIKKQQALEQAVTDEN
jgi:hypothetical protein